MQCVMYMSIFGYKFDRAVSVGFAKLNIKNMFSSNYSAKAKVIKSRLV